MLCGSVYSAVPAFAPSAMPMVLLAGAEDVSAVAGAEELSEAAQRPRRASAAWARLAYDMFEFWGAATSMDIAGGDERRASRKKNPALFVRALLVATGLLLGSSLKNHHRRSLFVNLPP